MTDFNPFRPFHRSPHAEPRGIALYFEGRNVYEIDTDNDNVHIHREYYATEIGETGEVSPNTVALVERSLWSDARFRHISVCPIGIFSGGHLERTVHDRAYAQRLSAKLNASLERFTEPAIEDPMAAAASQHERA